MLDLQTWEPRFKACGAVAALVSTVGLIVGGAFGLYTYRQQGEAAEALKQKELRLMQFNQKREVYYELVDAAAAVGTSRTKEEAIRNATKYSTLYFGRAHIFAIDQTVSDAKIAFYSKMLEVLEEGEFPSSELQSSALALASACKEVLKVQDVFATTGP